MQTFENNQHKATRDAISQLLSRYAERCRIVSRATDISEAEDHDMWLDSLNELVHSFGIEHASLVDQLIQEVSLHPSPEISSICEDIAQMFCIRHGLVGAKQAFLLRKTLVAFQVADPVTLFNLSDQKMRGEVTDKDVAGAHSLVEIVLQRVPLASSLRTQALIQMAMNLVDGMAVPVDLCKAHSMLLEAARMGSLEGAFNLGLFYDGRFYQGPSPFHDLDLAAFFYSVAQRGGHLSAQTNLALLHIEELIHSPDPKWGWELLRDASQKGDLVAEDCISMLSLH
jgi:hypothetical protein